MVFMVKCTPMRRKTRSPAVKVRSPQESGEGSSRPVVIVVQVHNEMGVGAGLGWQGDSGGLRRWSVVAGGLQPARARTAAPSTAGDLCTDGGPPEKRALGEEVLVL